MAKYLTITLLLAAFAFAAAWGLDAVGYVAGPDSWIRAWLADRGLLRAEAVEVRELCWIMGGLGSLFIAWVSVDAARLRHPAGIALGTIVLLVGLAPTMAMYDVWYPPTFAVAAVAACYLLGLAYAGTSFGRRKRRASRLLGRRLRGRGVWAALRPDSPLAAPVSAELTAVVCQALNAGEVRAALPPRDLVRQQAAFSRTCREVLLDAGALVSSPRPGCVVGWFGCFDQASAPADHPTAGADPSASGGTHAVDAMRAALALAGRLQAWRGEQEKKLPECMRPGIAVVSGPATLGVFEAAAGEEVGVFGELEESGLRVGAANALYGSRILVNPRARQLAGSQIEVRPMEMLYDPAVHGLIELSELIGMEGDLSEDERRRRDQFWEGIGHFRKREWGAAIEKFRAAETGETTDYPLEYFLASARKELASSSKRDSRAPAHARRIETI